MSDKLGRCSKGILVAFVLFCALIPSNWLWLDRPEMCDVEEEVWAISGLAGEEVESLSEAMGQGELFQA